MKHQAARQLVEAYVGGWRDNDLPRIVSTLSPDCVIIESHGPTYRGIDKVRQWVESWIAEGSTVDRWDITSFHFVEGTAVFEWGFECTVAGEHYRLDGASVVELEGDRIVALREYRRTELPFEWHVPGANPQAL
jgi:ketosteroid isomerase-like protein